MLSSLTNRRHGMCIEHAASERASYRHSENGTGAFTVVRGRAVCADVRNLRREGAFVAAAGVVQRCAA